MSKLMLIIFLAIIPLISCKKKCMHTNIRLNQSETYVATYDGEVSASIRGCSHVTCYINDVGTTLEWDYPSGSDRWSKTVLVVRKKDKITWSSPCNDDDLFLYYREVCE
jgi:hypothetical protein